MKTLTLIVLIASASLFSCKSTPQAMGTDKITPTNARNETAQKETIYDIIIMFISKASGIDSDLKAKIDTELATFNKEHNTDLKPEIVGWGREGERDYLFRTKNLSTKQKKQLIAQFKSAVGSSDMARIILNKKSVHKR